MAPDADVGVQHLAPSTYDRWFDSSWGRYAFDIESSAVIRSMGPVSGKTRILDVGCGTGRFAKLLETSGTTVVGTDIDPAMLEIASQRVCGPLVEADAELLPFSDGACEQVIAVTLCEFVQDPGEVFAELARVTRLGGRILVGSLNPVSPWGVFRWRRMRRALECIFLRAERCALGAPFGRVSILGALYSPELLAGPRMFGPMLERLGRLLPAIGAFQVMVIDRIES